jgi:saccharopine dehydrogenase-like NADP-dependent oxidoreductase
VLAQWQRKEVTRYDIAEFLKTCISGKIPSVHNAGAIQITLEGVTQGTRITRIASNAARQTEDSGKNMDDLTGTSLATFAAFMLRGSSNRIGVFAPEVAFKPDDVFAQLRQLGINLVDTMTWSEKTIGPPPIAWR